MCLHVNTLLHGDVYTPKVAEEDIVCYKALIYTKNEQTGKEFYISPFYSKTWEKGKTYDALALWPRLTVAVEDGYFHAYQQFSNAEALAKSFLGIYYSEMVIAKCIIPKGSEYYVGWDNSSVGCYASKSLKIEEVTKIEKEYVS